MMVPCDKKWYTRGWALVPPPAGSFATALNINSWALGVSDRGPPGGTFKWDDTQLVDDGMSPVAPSAILEAHPESPAKIESVSLVLPADYSPRPEIRAAVARITREQFAIAFGGDPCVLLRQDMHTIQRIAASSDTDPLDVIWACMEMCKGHLSKSATS